MVDQIIIEFISKNQSVSVQVDFKIRTAIHGVHRCEIFVKAIGGRFCDFRSFSLHKEEFSGYY